jgi:hypothetical protein
MPDGFYHYLNPALGGANFANARSTSSPTWRLSTTSVNYRPIENKTLLLILHIRFLEIPKSPNGKLSLQQHKRM